MSLTTDLPRNKKPIYLYVTCPHSFVRRCLCKNKNLWKSLSDHPYEVISSLLFVFLPTCSEQAEGPTVYPLLLLLYERELQPLPFWLFKLLIYNLLCFLFLGKERFGNRYFRKCYRLYIIRNDQIIIAFVRSWRRSVSTQL